MAKHSTITNIRVGVWREAIKLKQLMTLHRALLPPKTFTFDNMTAAGLLAGQLMRISFECTNPASWAGCCLLDVPGARTYPLTSQILHNVLGVFTNVSTTKVKGVVLGFVINMLFSRP